MNLNKKNSAYLFCCFLFFFSCTNKTEHETKEINANEQTIEKAKQAAEYNNLIVAEFENFQSEYIEFTSTIESFDKNKIDSLSNVIILSIDSSLIFFNKILPFEGDSAFAIAGRKFFETISLSFPYDLRELTLLKEKFTSFEEFVENDDVV
ncbi:MAG: hypothetical protein JXR58_04260, partial [Bacteroidales bacterium]|nr:hypothetical protein [Bacteroidales bacterium]